MKVIHRTIFFAAWSLGLVASAATAQGCHHSGSHFVAASVEASPTVLDCCVAPTWPDWHLFTPAHREPGPHLGFDPGPTCELPRILVAYRCTGFLLLPVVPWRIVKMGYVVDRAEVACASATGG